MTGWARILVLGAGRRGCKEGKVKEMYLALMRFVVVLSSHVNSLHSSELAPKKGLFPAQTSFIFAVESGPKEKSCTQGLHPRPYVSLLDILDPGYEPRV